MKIDARTRRFGAGRLVRRGHIPIQVSLYPLQRRIDSVVIRFLLCMRCQNGHRPLKTLQKVHAPGPRPIARGFRRTRIGTDSRIAGKSCRFRFVSYTSFACTHTTGSILIFLVWTPVFRKRHPHLQCN